MKLEIPDIKGKELFKWLIENKSLLISQKKFEMKRADCIGYSGNLFIGNDGVLKAASPAANKDSLDVTAIINTTYYYDSHGDVHIDGLWKKSLSENKNIFHLEEHVNSFKNLISDDVKAYTKKITWKSLGIDAEGSTEALVFESKITRNKDNSDMMDRYINGQVRQHSVGMRYVKMDLAINDEDYPADYELWNKYIDKIVNRKEVEDAGYFWPVTEAKVIEGSAVLIASNPVTPTTSVKNEPSLDTQQHKTAANKALLSELNKLQSQVKSILR